MNGKTATLLRRYTDHLQLFENNDFRKIKKKWKLSTISEKTNERKIIKTILKKSK